MHVAQVLITACAFFSIASAEVYQVTVGANNTSEFQPPFISGFNTAQDSIEFVFSPGAFHSATESRYHFPCNLSTYKDAIDTTSSGVVSLPHRDGDVWWFHSQGENDCKSGMVFAINPGMEDDFIAFRDSATNDEDPICPIKDKSCAP